MDPARHGSRAFPKFLCDLRKPWYAAGLDLPSWPGVISIGLGIGREHGLACLASLDTREMIVHSGSLVRLLVCKH
jgi:hypothetical protein